MPERLQAFRLFELPLVTFRVIFGMQLRTIAYTMKNNDTLDQIDQHILAELARHARISVAELSRRVNLSKTPCQARINRLEQAGYILGYRAIIDPERLGRPHVAFVEVKLSDTRKAALAAFNKAVQAVPEIEQAHMIASSFDYLLKVRTQDISEYREVLGEKISSLPHIAHTSTHVSMEAVKGDAPSLKSKNT